MLFRSLIREVKQRGDFKFYTYSPVLPSGVSWPFPNSNSNGNLSTLANMPENAIDPGEIYSWTCVNTKVGTQWKNFKTCGTNPNYYNTPSGDNHYTGTQKYGDYSGEWRYMGYTSTGTAATNPFMPSDYEWNASVANYSYKEIIPAGTKEGTLIFTSKKLKFFSTEFDDSNNETLYSLKIKAIEELLNMEGIKGNAADWADKLSLRNDPRYDTPMLIGVWYTGGFYIDAVGPATEMQQDLILTELTIKDESGKVIMTVGRNSSGTVSTTTNQTRVLETNNIYTIEATIKNESPNQTKLLNTRVKHQFQLGNNTPGSWQIGRAHV